MSKKTPQKNTPVSPDQVMYLLFSHAIGDLEGQILTFIDASIQDPIQRKALKDLLRPMIWRWAIEHNSADFYEIKSNGLEEYGSSLGSIVSSRS